MVHIGNEWDELLAPEFESEWYAKLREFLKSEYSKYTIFEFIPSETQGLNFFKG